jgi:hypothetical protein
VTSSRQTGYLPQDARREFGISAAGKIRRRTLGRQSEDTPRLTGDRHHPRRAWARLIRKVWAADPLACPKCGGRLRIISFIEDPAVIEKILRHLKLWNPLTRPPPPRPSVCLEMDPDFIAWQAASRLFDGID